MSNLLRSTPSDSIQVTSLVEESLKINISAFAELPEDCRGRWESFVDETLRETNRRNTVELVRYPSVALRFHCIKLAFNFLSSPVSQLSLLCLE